MSRRFQRKNHRGNWTASGIRGKLRFPKQLASLEGWIPEDTGNPVKDSIRESILEAAKELYKEDAFEKRGELYQKKQPEPPDNVKTLEEAQDIANRISLSTHNPPIEVGVLPAFSYFGETRVHIQCRMMVNDRDSGFPIPLYNSTVVTLPVATGSFLCHIRAGLFSLVTHEIDEHFKFDRKRTFEPHPHGF